MKLWLSLPWILIVACAEGESASPASRVRNADVRSSEEQGEDLGGVEVVDASIGRRAPSSADAGQAQSGSGGARASDAGGSKAMMSSERARDDAGAAMARARAKDAGVQDAGEDATRPDSAAAAPEPEPKPEPEPANTGSCCSAGSGPGCGDSALQACVCALSPRCCSDGWDESCARLVREKNCQSGVRECVCGNSEGQWQQAYCCEGGWNATCESVSIHKCGATAACP